MNLPSGPQRGYITLILLVFDLQFTNQSLDLYPCASCLDCVIVAVFCLMRRSYKIGLRVRKLYQCTSTIFEHHSWWKRSYQAGFLPLRVRKKIVRDRSYPATNCLEIWIIYTISVKNSLSEFFYSSVVFHLFICVCMFFSFLFFLRTMRFLL